MYTLNVDADQFDALWEAQAIAHGGETNDTVLDAYNTSLLGTMVPLQIISNLDLTWLIEKIREWMRKYGQMNDKLRDFLNQKFIEIRGDEIFIYLPKVQPNVPAMPQ